MRKPKRLAALCAAFFMAVSLCSTVVHAEETPVGSASSTPESSAPVGADLPSGTGTVKEVYTDEDGRKFYTVQTPAGNTFYLIIDFTQQTENVYFLDAVAEKDLLALIEQAGGTVTDGTESTPDEEAGDVPVSEPSGEEAAGQTENENSSGLFSMILIAAVVVIGGGAALYFKVIRKKRGNPSTHEEYEEDDISDEPGTDLPPWDDEQEDDHV